MKRIKSNLPVVMALKGFKTIADVHRRIEILGFNMNLRTIYKLYHNTSSRVDYDTLEILCNALDCGIEELLILENEKGEE